ncbi:TetR/AcrR family transcriptional regulator [Undibacterium sp. TJN25]|uniref:TetR/AcrR family transcriptional regulator n=1 Tax=Undibacterium sp. TJN25 TaxID=3413056 RepID=UPI003BF0B69A
MAKLIAERADVIPQLAEIFRTYGFEGASLARITEGTKLGKGSIYHFFPGGKEEMAAAVLSEIDGWFSVNAFLPLREEALAAQGISRMFDEVQRYFLSGRKVCLVGVFALGNERDRFGAAVKAYFKEWVEALTAALVRNGRDAASATDLAEEVVAGIQGGLVLARALNQPKVFVRMLDRLKLRCA